MSRAVRRWGWAALFAAVVCADQVSKRAAMGLEAPVTLISGVLGLRYMENTGVAFSMLADLPWLSGALSVLLLCGGYLVLRRFTLGPMTRLGACLVCAGAVGNLIDRVLRGCVVDMLEFLFVRFAVFNVADVAVCVGCGLLGLSLLVRPGEWTAREEERHG